MSKYTITIDELIDINYDFGLDKYEIFDEDYRPILNNAILEHYRFREIAWTNPNQWRNRLQTRMNRIMREKYNRLYSAKSIEFNPLFNVDMTETYTHTIDHTSEGTNNVDELVDTKSQSDVSVEGNSTATNTKNSEGSSLNLNSSFPSEEMTENDYTNSVYVDSANRNTSKGTEKDNAEENSSSIQNAKSSGNNKRNLVATDNTNNSTNETYVRKTEGSSAGLPFSRAMLQLKDFYDEYMLDTQVIDELKDLFISIW